MKIVTYNMQHDKKSHDNWQAILEREDPDILLAQESLDPSRVFRPLLDSQWPSQVVWVPLHTGWGSAVYVRAHKPNQIELPGFHGWVVGAEVPAPAELIPGGRTLRIFSIHAPTGQGSYSSVVNAIFDLLRDYRQDGDVIIAGDFNLEVSVRHASEERQTPRCDLAIQTRLRDEFGLTNCWQLSHPQEHLAQTLRWDRDPKTVYHCDGIFVPRSWAARLQACEVLCGSEWTAISDHNPVVAVFGSPGAAPF
ncbi:MAG: hypothetical protein FJ276_02250 [Planctomycetes bacterium]|nr:hypothetical protein [Planctomycetota bacterium]